MTNLALYHPSGQFGLPNNPFGKDVANLQLFQALARYGGFERLELLTHHPVDQRTAREGLIGDAPKPEIGVGSILSTRALKAAGAVLRGQPYLQELAWRRRSEGDERAYSLIGMIHTLAPLAVRELIAANLSAPTQAWDAVICTSPSVRAAVTRLFAEQGEWLAERTGGRPPPTPHTPVIPLGVDGAHFAKVADRPAARRSLREELRLGEDDILLLWVGRLSFFEKAFPQPMLKAARMAAERTGARVVFAMAGWFPDADNRRLYEQAVRTHAEGVEVRFEDGNDRERLADLWAAADIFLSLVDNVQETFGITPIEAMAAGLPVVVSDWDGYRFTVQDNVQGFLIPTLGGPSSGGMGGVLSARHALGIDSYHSYGGAIAQHTAVHIGRCAEALAQLIGSKALRQRMGAAGRERIQTVFDWPVVARQIAGLVEDLAKVRAAAPESVGARRGNPAKGDPFRDFSHFPSEQLRLETRLSVAPGQAAADVAAVGACELDLAFPGLRASPARSVEVFERIAGEPGVTLRDVLVAFPTAERRVIEMSVAWLAKYGFVDWLEP